MGQALTFAALVAIGLAGCGSNAAGDAGPAPSLAWTLDADGKARAGGRGLTFTGGYTPAERAVAFDGVTGYAHAEGRGALTTTDSFTVAAWVTLGARPEFATVVSQSGELASPFFLGVGEGSWVFAMKDADTNEPGHTIRALGARPTADPDHWIHLAGVYDKPAGAIRLYVDGKRAAERPFQKPWQATGSLVVGAAQAHGAMENFWPGAIGDVRVYPIALDDRQVRTLLDDSRPTAGPPPMPEPPRPACANPDGGQCLGPLEPGTYTTRSFSPALTYTTPRGWTNGEDLGGNFLLQLDGDKRFIGIYRDANAPDGCAERPDPRVSQSVPAYLRWLRRNPLLHTSTPRRVTIGGLHGVVVDISKAPHTKGKGCTYDAYTGNAPFIIGGRGPASLHHVIMDAPGWTERFYLLRQGRGNVAIEVSPEGDALAAYLKSAMPIVHSLRFARE